MTEKALKTAVDLKTKKTVSDIDVSDAVQNGMQRIPG